MLGQGFHRAAHHDSGPAGGVPRRRPPREGGPHVHRARLPRAALIPVRPAADRGPHRPRRRLRPGRRLPPSPRFPASLPRGVVLPQPHTASLRLPRTKKEVSPPKMSRTNPVHFKLETPPRCFSEPTLSEACLFCNFRIFSVFFRVFFRFFLGFFRFFFGFRFFFFSVFFFFAVLASFLEYFLFSSPPR